MKCRIALWAFAGLVVAGWWMLYFSSRDPGTAIPLLARSLARYSCPIVLIGDHFNFGVHYSWVFLTNAAVYALVGTIVETVRHQLRKPMPLKTAR